MRDSKYIRSQERDFQTHTIFHFLKYMSFHSAERNKNLLHGYDAFDYDRAKDMITKGKIKSIGNFSKIFEL